MGDEQKTKAQLIQELRQLKKQLAEVQRSEETNRSAKETLQMSEMKYRLLVETSLSGIFVFQEGKTKYVNQSAINMFGYSEEEWRAKSFLDFIHPDDRQAAAARYINILNSEAVAPTVLRRFVDNQGQTRWAEINGLRIEWEGSPAVLAFVNDITERKSAEEALRESEQKYRLFVENALNGICVLQDGLLKYANPSLIQLMGYSDQEILSRPFVEFVHPEDRQASVDRYMQILKEQAVVPSITRRIIDKNNQVRWIEINGVRVDWEGRPAALAFIRDITKRKWAEDELAARALKLEEANTALRVLLEQRDRDRKEFENTIITNIKTLVLPYLVKLNDCGLPPDQKAYLEVAATGLKNITSPFLRTLSAVYAGLTPMEIQVAEQVREGKTTKEIASLLSLSTKTIDCHRDSIRSKLNLKNKKANLRSFLQTLE